MPRIGPTAPGCTVFSEPSHIVNPGPGQYFGVDDWNENINYSRKTKFQTNGILTPKPKPPSIPDHKKAFVKNKNYCTGLGFDTVGPQYYKPNHDKV